MDGEIAELLTQIGANKSTTIDVARKILGEGTDNEKNQVELVVRRDLADLKRMESPPRNHRFITVDGFCQYIDKYKTAETVVFADPSQGSLWAVLDEKAEQGREQICFNPTPHPQIKPWLDLIEAKPHLLPTLADFMIAQRRTVKDPDPKHLSQIFSQIRIASNSTAEVGVGAESVNGLVVSGKVQGIDLTKKAVELPEVVTIHCPLYIGRDPIDIEIDLTVRNGQGTVFVLVTSSHLDVAIIEAYQAFADEVREALPESVLVTMGSPAYKNWDYQKGSDL